MFKPFTRIFICIAGIAAIVIGIIITVNGSKLNKACTYEIEATVIGVSEHETTDSDGDWYTEYLTELQYEYEGKTYKIDGPSSSIQTYSLGDKYTIKIDPDNPATANVDGTAANIIFPIIFIVMGVICLLAGIFGKTLKFGR